MNGALRASGGVCSAVRREAHTCRTPRHAALASMSSIAPGPGGMAKPRPSVMSIKHQPFRSSKPTSPHLIRKTPSARASICNGTCQAETPMDTPSRRGAPNLGTPRHTTLRPPPRRRAHTARPSPSRDQRHRPDERRMPQPRLKAIPRAAHDTSRVPTWACTRRRSKRPGSRVVLPHTCSHSGRRERRTDDTLNRRHPASPSRPTRRRPPRQYAA